MHAVLDLSGLRPNPTLVEADPPLAPGEVLSSKRLVVALTVFNANYLQFLVFNGCWCAKWWGRIVKGNHCLCLCRLNIESLTVLHLRDLYDSHDENDQSYSIFFLYWYSRSRHVLLICEKWKGICSKRHWSEWDRKNHTSGYTAGLINVAHVSY